MFLTGFSDAQCGFKAVSQRAARDLLSLVQDNSWFFDTELLLLAERNGYRIDEIPVRWTDNPDSRVRIVRTAWDDFQGLLRLRFADCEGRHAPFQNVGVMLAGRSVLRQVIQECNRSPFVASDEVDAEGTPSSHRLTFSLNT